MVVNFLTNRLELFSTDSSLFSSTGILSQDLTTPFGLLEAGTPIEDIADYVYTDKPLESVSEFISLMLELTTS